MGKVFASGMDAGEEGHGGKHPYCLFLTGQGNQNCPLLTKLGIIVVSCYQMTPQISSELIGKPPVFWLASLILGLQYPFVPIGPFAVLLLWHF